MIPWLRLTYVEHKTSLVSSDRWGNYRSSSALNFQARGAVNSANLLCSTAFGLTDSGPSSIHGYSSRCWGGTFFPVNLVPLIESSLEIPTLFYESWAIEGISLHKSLLTILKILGYVKGPSLNNLMDSRVYWLASSYKLRSRQRSWVASLMCAESDWLLESHGKYK